MARGRRNVPGLAVVDAGESNATIAKRLGMDLTSVAHRLALLELLAELSDAMRAGRCTSPRTLYELAKMHREEPERVRALLDGDGEINRGAVNAVRAKAVEPAQGARQRHAQPPLLAQADAVCARLVDGSRLPQPLAERQADRAALFASNDRMATLSTDLVALVTLLRQAKVEQARPYRDRLETARRRAWHGRHHGAPALHRQGGAAPG